MLLITMEFRCEDCNYSLASKQKLQQHLLTKKHLNRKQNKEFRCEDCDYSFASKQMLQKHLLSKRHLNRDLKFKCRYCKEILNTENQKMRHEINYHEGVEILANSIREQFKTIKIEHPKKFPSFEKNSLYVMFKFIRIFLKNILVKKAKVDNKILILYKGLWVSVNITPVIIGTIFNELLDKLEEQYSDTYKIRIEVLFNERDWSRDFYNLERKLENYSLFTADDKQYIRSLFNLF